MDRGYGSSAEVLRSIREFELAQDSQQMQDILQDCSHYWVTAQSELSTDILFRSRQGLSELYPELLSHGTLCFGAKEVMTFLGRKLAAISKPRSSPISPTSPAVCRDAESSIVSKRTGSRWSTSPVSFFGLKP